MSRILHLCLSNFYIDGYSYQENEIIKEHVNAGHEVFVIASTETISNSGQLTYLDASEYQGLEGASIRRIQYHPWLPHTVARKIRAHQDVYQHIANFEPDVILFHGACGWEVRTAAHYAINHPHVKFYIDSHEDQNNSARTFVSREILHRRFYGPILRSAMGPAEKILCISLETIDFVRDMYHVPPEKLEFFPLGGHPLSDDEYSSERARVRNKLGLSDQHVMFLQTGKFGKAKRLVNSLRAFVATPDPDFRLFLSGVISKDENEKEILGLIASDARIQFLGWSSASELRGLLAACDVYLQPGSQSVTMQNSLCQRCAVIIDNVKSHQPFLNGNGYFTDGGNDLPAILAAVSQNKARISDMRRHSHAIALELLDYSKLAQRVLR